LGGGGKNIFREASNSGFSMNEYRHLRDLRKQAAHH